MAKDQAIGAIILATCAIIVVGYLAGLFLYDPYIISWLNVGTSANVHYWLVAAPVAIGFVAILAIGAWIGYTMATTPSPKPIEETKTKTENKTDENKPT